MVACLFPAIRILFFRMVFRALSSGAINGRGWGFSTRTHQRDGEPIWCWITFSS
jgi:hypothetical protein